MGLREWLSKIPFIEKRIAADNEELNQLRKEFSERYNAFKTLISENQRSLKTISDMENALAGNLLFDMSFVRFESKKILESVSRIIEQLEKIAPGKYRLLFESFGNIEHSIRESLETKHTSQSAPLVLALRDIDRTRASETGNKMANLGELGKQSDLKIPNGFVITAEAYLKFKELNGIQPEIDRLIQTTARDDIDELTDLSNGIRQFIVGCPVPKALKAEIEEQLSIMASKDEPDVSLVMRSSALGEDGPETSFAGQYRTIFNVDRDNIFLAYKEVVASKYQVQAMMYRLNFGIRDEDVSMCVGCMPLIDTVAGGVAYTGNPLNKEDNNLIILSVFGHPKPVVDGKTATDLFVVSREGKLQIIEEKIAAKEHQYVAMKEEGIIPFPIEPQKRSQPSLERKKILELSGILLKIERHYGCAQDVEWVLDRKGDIIVLQSRILKQKELQHTPPGQLEDAELKKSLICSGGITASPGSASGEVCVIEKEKDAVHFKEGGVLVSSQSLPYFAVILNRAAAVITERGSVAGHLANVAREFNVPAIFGLENATKILKDKTTITVDADAQRIYSGKHVTLTKKPKEKARSMIGNSTYKALRKVSENIVPLRLINPDSAQFVPEKCTTLHDIIRFCHEKSVLEMFETGMESRFKKSSSKRLHYNGVPMQFWIIDLEDGVRNESENKRFVPIEDIVSIPMLAIWRGMNAFSWEGPPPVDAKGFASVLMGSTANPSLNPSGPSVYTTRNYFMISKHFCSFQSRFGYHFSNVETLVSENPGENYIRFQFKGGAADLPRRMTRANIVTEALERKGFQVVTKQDSVSAKLETFERPFMESRLEVLGYLSVHTRQLDMAMGNAAAIEKYRKKIMSEIDQISSS